MCKNKKLLLVFRLRRDKIDPKKNATLHHNNTNFALVRGRRGDSIMSGSVPPTQLPPPSPPGLEQSQVSVLGTCICCQWFSVPQHSESSVLSTVVIFLLPGWGDYAHLVPSFPSDQSDQLNMFTIGSNSTRHRETLNRFLEKALLETFIDLMFVLLPSVLDLIPSLTGILLHYLTRTMKRVYAAHKRKRIFRLANIVWQSALPPTLCAVLYIQFSSARQLAGATDADDRLHVSALDADFPVDDRKALRSFAFYIIPGPRLQHKWDGRPLRGDITSDLSVSDRSEPGGSKTEILTFLIWK
ncbi:hypothetical protein EDB86DRAFT_2831753 [Lactarius hatsudake]|nr:hypothetical protein EDB86DRAFT_2831753 [Lactarius hatsudake]